MNCEYCTRPHGEAATCEGCGAPVRGRDGSDMNGRINEILNLAFAEQQGRMWLYNPQIALDLAQREQLWPGQLIAVAPGAQNHLCGVFEIDANGLLCTTR